MNIHQLIAQIPEEAHDEQLMSLETVTFFPADQTARLRCHLTQEFRLWVNAAHGYVSAEGREARRFTEASFVSVLRQTIAEVDEDMARGVYQQTPPGSWVVDDTGAPPSHLELPVRDPITGGWRDAEY